MLVVGFGIDVVVLISVVVLIVVNVVVLLLVTVLFALRSQLVDAVIVTGLQVEDAGSR